MAWAPVLAFLAYVHPLRPYPWLLGALSLALAAPAAAEPRSPSGVQALRMNATSDGVAVVAGQPVQFFDGSVGEPTSWEWDFTYEPGVATVDSREQNPVWTFAEAGLWSVRLEACNDSGCGAAVKQIEVVPPCTLTPDLVLGPSVVEDTQTFEACHTITAESGFSVIEPGSVTFRAGRSVAIGNGFSVGGGAGFRVVIDPLLDIP
jgi:hypothetical protein